MHSETDPSHRGRIMTTASNTDLARVVADMRSAEGVLSHAVRGGTGGIEAARAGGGRDGAPGVDRRSAAHAFRLINGEVAMSSRRRKEPGRPAQGPGPENATASCRPRGTASAEM